MFYVGLDVHQTTSTACILDRDGHQVKQMTVKGHWTKMIDQLATFKKTDHGKLTVCYEASCGYGAIHDRMAKIAKRIVVAHPRRLRLIYASKRKNDKVDAQKLAKLVYMDMVPQVHVPNINVRDWRGLIEFRRRTVDKRTRVKNQIHALMRTHGVVKPRGVGGLWTNKGKAWLTQDTRWPTTIAQLQCDDLLEELEQLNQRTRKITNELNRIGRKHPGVALLKSIPGVGPRTAEAMIAYVDDSKRFVRNKQIGAYLGLVPCQDASAKSNRLGHITKEGPGTVRKLLTEATWQAIRRDEHMKAYYERIVGGKSERRKIALVATAHHLARCMLAMLKSGETWNPDRQGEVELAMAA